MANNNNNAHVIAPGDGCNVVLMHTITVIIQLDTNIQIVDGRKVISMVW